MDAVSVRAEVTARRAPEYVALMQGDPSTFGASIIALNASLDAEVKAILDAEAQRIKDIGERNAAAVGAWEQKVLAVLATALKPLEAGFLALEGTDTIVCTFHYETVTTVTKAEDGSESTSSVRNWIAPTLHAKGLTITRQPLPEKVPAKASSEEPTTRTPFPWKGVTYKTGAAAVAALMPDLVGRPMSRKTIIQQLTKRGK